MSSCSCCSDTPGFLKPRYSSRQVRALFGISAGTLRDWLRRGMPLPGRRRVRFPHLRFPGGRPIFVQEDVDRLYEERTGSSVTAARIRPLPIVMDLDTHDDDECGAVCAHKPARILSWPGNA